MLPNKVTCGKPILMGIILCKKVSFFVTRASHFLRGAKIWDKKLLRLDSLMPLINVSFVTLWHVNMWDWDSKIYPCKLMLKRWKASCTCGTYCIWQGVWIFSDKSITLLMPYLHWLKSLVMKQKNHKKTNDTGDILAQKSALKVLKFLDFFDKWRGVTIEATFFSQLHFWPFFHCLKVHAKVID